MANTSTPIDLKSSRGLASEKSERFHTKSFEEMYAKNDFKGAASYLIHNKQQLDSGIFHYNLGTVYSKMGDFALARFHFEKAIKEGFINSSSLNNLNFIKTKLQVDDLSTSNDLSDQALSAMLAFPASAYLTLSLIIVLIGLFWARVKKSFNPSRLAVVVASALLPMMMAYFYLSNVQYAIALKDVPLYEGPSKIFNEKGKMRAGSKVILGEFKEGWFFVKHPVSLAGWVAKDQLGLY